MKLKLKKLSKLDDITLDDFPFDYIKAKVSEYEYVGRCYPLIVSTSKSFLSIRYLIII